MPLLRFLIVCGLFLETLTRFCILVTILTTARVDTSGIEDINLALQEAELFEAQAKGVPFTWRNNQDDDPISTNIDHAFINQQWSDSFPDAYADFLDPSQSDHAPCLFRVPSLRRQVCTPFKFFHHVIDHPQYADLVREGWQFNQIVGTNQFKLVRSFKLLKPMLRGLNKRNYSGISQRVREKSAVVDSLQRALLTSPDIVTARGEHSQRAELNILLTTEGKFYRQRSRVQWADVGDRKTVFYHRTVSQHATRNHIHFLKDQNDQLIFTADDIKSHSASYFQSILGTTDLPVSMAPLSELQDLLPFRCTDIQQAYLSRSVLEAEIKATIFSMPLNKSYGPDGYSMEFIRSSWDIVGGGCHCSGIGILQEWKITKWELAGFFEGRKGLRQGDCISPYLFIMVMEVLSILLNRADQQGEFRLHPLCTSPRLTHLLFADDLLVFSDGSRFSINGIKSVMASFKLWSGLDMNEAKSEIFFGGYTDIHASVLADLSGFKWGSFPTRYLGLPLDPKRIAMATLQTFLERITSKLHSWTVKCLSFAGKVHLIYFYGMVNFWISVFVLPKRFYEKVDSLCSAFLWKNRTSSASGARVSWSDICKPKKEGGLGLRKLEKFELIFRLKRLWNFFSNSGSLWVAWLSHNRFGDKNFWLVRDSQRFSATIRGMLQLKNILPQFLRCAVGDGQRASFWYDYWTDLGPLYLLFSSCPRQLQVLDSASVSDAVRNVEWFLPPARSENAVTLQIVLSSTAVPSVEKGGDTYLWRIQSGGFANKFSSQITWDRLRTSSAEIVWHDVIWFKEEVLRCSFVVWMSMLGRLPTKDRLISWGLSVPANCVLCANGIESHNHLFFGCPYAVAIWTRYCGRFISVPPLDLPAAVNMISQYQGQFSSQVRPIMKLILQAVIYSLWRERNARIFRDVSLPVGLFFKQVDRGLRDRLLSLPPSPTDAHSLLELYFWFTDPYS
ncbi:PREDICTED: uncharacterized protein LOC106344713 [Brassica oleracea var. oleracea]|uniref:uncharacterized protein LOC106344713 n=1 Tax=Brassica oleracea var. oleracea TaxID=109376 RepID=UPI0006A6EA8F|nr:PREDICTED: uncharacterized protein LOC106344713 [Brassica oleracea var. oleracea]